MEPIKIVGEWRRGGNLKFGLYLYRCPENVDFINVATLAIGTDRLEYLGPIEIVEPEPVPTPLPGCKCETGVNVGGRYYVRSIYGTNEAIAVSAYGDNLRQAILRHNAAVAAIVAMESPQ